MGNRDDGGGPRERPKLQLAKRTAPASSGSDRPAPPAAKSNPFENAKPIDSAAKEREIEEKLAKDRPQATRNTREERSRTTSERSDDSRENNRQKEAPEKSDRPAAPAAKSNPFGNAKPVDRSERPERSADDSRDNRDSRENNRQIDEEPKSDRPAPPAKSDRPPPSAGKSNPFGNAKPIDSTKREREMEEKLRKTEIVDDKSRSKTPTNQKPQHTEETTTTNSDEKSGGDGPKKSPQSASTQRN